MATAFKIALDHLDIYQLVFYASLSSAVVLIIPVCFGAHLNLLLKTLRQHWRYSIMMACLNPTLYYIVLFSAYDRLPAQVAQPINYTWAIVLTFMSVIFLKQKPSRLDFLAAFICYTGVIVIATSGEAEILNDIDYLGITLAIISTFVWAGYWILNVQDKRDQRVAMCINFLIALPLSAFICGVFSNFSIPVEGAIGAGYIGIFEMGLAFLFWSKALRLTNNTSRVSTLIFLSPFLSLFFISQILEETIQSTTYVGLVVIVVGLTIQRIKPNSENQPS